MTVDRFPGDFRVGVLNEQVSAVSGRWPQMVEPKLQLLVILSGYQEFTVGPARFVFTADTAPTALLMRIGREQPMAFDVSRGAPLLKIAVAMPVDWLQSFDGDGAANPALPGGNDPAALAWCQWHPGAELLAKARQIVAAREKMQRMTLGLALLRRALADLPGATPLPPAAPDPRMAVVRDYLAGHPAGPLTAAEIARACALSLRTLQRIVKQSEGCTLGDMLRERSFDAGLRALASPGTSIAEAAWIAGYSTPANFATAVKRRFGTTPSRLRRQPTA